MKRKQMDLMVKKLWRSMRCRMRHGHACPHVTAYHQTPRERARARGQLVKN